MKALIVIPARFQSTRLPGKPLAKICGQTMLERVVNICQHAAKQYKYEANVLVATDDKKIVEHCEFLGVTAVMTSPDAPTGTDRVAEVLTKIHLKPDFILNMQGDAPLTPPDFLLALLQSFEEQPCDAITPVTQLSWEELDRLRENKKSTPFSGTTAVFNHETGRAFWFSKTILPAIRNEKDLRAKSIMSPIYRHIGLYGYSYSMLKHYVTLPESSFEKLEGLEQLRLLEHGYHLRCVPVEFNGRANMSGVDSPEDLIRAEHLILKHGELLP